ncbi:MAG: hypothetical protein A2289_01195 [Deltaproteobacteria bacterium RIFOXYA12_FULL_58_15]|nr:MAG: hypothetical protein A2289_01195 [Deltaproteobacteria bacterium RIFOXYA12_FULL_58_15]
MAADSTLTSFGTDAVEAHDKIRATIAEVRRALEALDTTVPDPRVHARIQRHLGTLEVHLQAHFGAEEVAGLHDRLKDVMNESAGELSRLQQEHQPLLADLQRLRNECHLCSPVNAERLHGELGPLLVGLESHEKAENEIMSLAFGPPR